MTQPQGNGRFSVEHEAKVLEVRKGGKQIALRAREDVKAGREHVAFSMG